MQPLRIIATLVVREGIVVQSINFETFYPIGRVDVCVENLNRWGVDEIAILDIDATREKRTPDERLIFEVSRFCHTPLTVGGGVSSLDDIRNLIRGGADKVCINNAFYRNPNFVRQAASVFGNQCIMISIDVRKNPDGGYEVYLDNGRMPSGKNPEEIAKEAQQCGAGEILLSSIDRNGTKIGYDIELIRNVADSVQIPVIACGGVGHPEHFYEGYSQGGVKAVAAGNFFNFTEHSVVVAKSYLRNKSAPIRMDTYFQYDDFDFDSGGRIAKMDEEKLENLLYQNIPKEVI